MEVTGINRRLPAEMETTLFRIGQEAISNTFKHAQARKVVLVIALIDNSIMMQIKDDGQGFVNIEMWNTTNERARLGLLGMRERVGLLGGIIEVNSQVGVGTIVTVKLELSQKELSKEGN